jgi:uncharacterized BrkB/YihY/UPF0761 family membrane protein
LPKLKIENEELRNKRDTARFSIFNSRYFLFLRGAVPLLLVALALLAGPALLVWWLRGGPFGVDDALIGGAISVVLLIVLGLAFGWAVGRIVRGRRDGGRRTKDDGP